MPGLAPGQGQARGLVLEPELVLVLEPGLGLEQVLARALVPEQVPHRQRQSSSQLPPVLT